MNDTLEELTGLAIPAGYLMIERGPLVLGDEIMYSRSCRYDPKHPKTCTGYEIVEGKVMGLRYSEAQGCWMYTIKYADGTWDLRPLSHFYYAIGAIYRRRWACRESDREIEVMELCAKGLGRFACPVADDDTEGD